MDGKIAKPISLYKYIIPKIVDNGIVINHYKYYIILLNLFTSIVPKLIISPKLN